MLTILPQRVLSAHALAQAQRVSLVALVGALTLGLVLAAVFHRTVALRIARLATRIDRVAATEGVLLDSTTKDEIRQPEEGQFVPAGGGLPSEADGGIIGLFGLDPIDDKCEFHAAVLSV